MTKLLLRHGQVGSEADRVKLMSLILTFSSMKPIMGTGFESDFLFQQLHHLN